MASKFNSNNADLELNAVGGDIVFKKDDVEVGRVGAGGAGKVLQVVNVEDGELITGTTTIPVDDTIPQNTEGTEFMSLAITPKYATSKLKVEVVFHSSHSAINTWLICALFRDAGAVAIGVGVSSETVATYMNSITYTVYVDSVSTTLTTFKVRAGSNQAGTMTFNGVSGSRFLGGSMASSITITEIGA